MCDVLVVGGSPEMHAYGVMIYNLSVDEIQHVVLVKYTLCVMKYMLVSVMMVGDFSGNARLRVVIYNLWVDDIQHVVLVKYNPLG